MAIHNPHDKYFRKSLSYPSVAQDFFEVHLPALVGPQFASQIDLDGLSLCPTSFVDHHLNEQQCDVLYQTKTKEEEPCYLYLLTEHQSTADPLMPFRMLEYPLKIVNYHLAQHPSETSLPLIVPILYYHGADGKPYPHPLKFFDLFKKPIFCMIC